MAAEAREPNGGSGQSNAITVNHSAPNNVATANQSNHTRPGAGRKGTFK